MTYLLFQIYQKINLALNDPSRVDIPFNKNIKSNQILCIMRHKELHYPAAIVKCSLGGGPLSKQARANTSLEISQELHSISVMRY